MIGKHARTLEGGVQHMGRWEDSLQGVVPPTMCDLGIELKLSDLAGSAHPLRQPMPSAL